MAPCTRARQRSAVLIEQHARHTQRPGLGQCQSRLTDQSVCRTVECPLGGRQTSDNRPRSGTPAPGPPPPCRRGSGSRSVSGFAGRPPALRHGWPTRRPPAAVASVRTRCDRTGCSASGCRDAGWNSRCTIAVASWPSTITVATAPRPRGVSTAARQVAEVRGVAIGWWQTVAHDSPAWRRFRRVQDADGSGE